MNRSKGLARFTFMHCIASSICFWLNAITKETLDSLVAKTYFDDSTKCGDDYGNKRSYVDEDKWTWLQL